MDKVSTAYKMKLHELFVKAKAKGNMDAMWTQMKDIIHSAAAKKHRIRETHEKSVDQHRDPPNDRKERKGSTKAFLRREVKKSVRKDRKAFYDGMAERDDPRG